MPEQNLVVEQQAIVEEQDIEVWHDPEPEPAATTGVPEGRHPMLKAAAIAALAVGIAVGIGLLISEVGDTDSEAGAGGSVPEDCRPIPFSTTARPC